MINQTHGLYMYEILTPSSCLDAAFALRVPSATTVTMATDATAICKDEAFIVVFMLSGNYQKWLRRSIGSLRRSGGGEK